MKKLLLPVAALLCLGVNAQTHYTENFNAGTLTGWTAVDVDGDGENWYNGDFSGYFAELEGGTAVSRSWTSAAGALQPNNFLVSGAINLTAAPASGLTLLFQTGTIEGAPYHAEHYALYVTTSNDPAVIAAATPVFEETLPSDGMFTHQVDMSSYAGQTVYLTIRHFNTNDMNTLLFDNISVKNVQPNDVSVADVNVARYAQTSTNNTLSVDVKNEGSNPVTSIELNWNDGTDHISTITTSIAPGATATVNHPTAVTAATAVEKNIAVSISLVNTVVDSDPSNNNGAALFNTVSQIATKKVVIEEGTGTWCGWCPRGAVAMDYMTSTYPTQFIGVAVHNGDPMTVAAYDNGANFSGFPGCNVDRALLDQSVSQSYFENYYNARKDLTVPAAVSATVSGSGSNLTIDASATFYTVFSAADYRLGVIIVEDDVRGTSSGYNQTNYYANNANGAMGGYENLPSPVPAAQMEYDHVGRALLGGYNGQAGTVPATITDGQTVSYSFSYTVPTTSNKAVMHAVVVLIDQVTGEIVNAEEVDLSSAGIADVSTIDMNVYPNPATDNLTVAFEAVNGDYTVSITDLQGRTVVSNVYSNISGTQAINVPVDGLATGNYIVNIATTGASYSQMVSIK